MNTKDIGSKMHAISRSNNHELITLVYSEIVALDFTTNFDVILVADSESGLNFFQTARFQKLWPKNHF